MGLVGERERDLMVVVGGEAMFVATEGGEKWSSVVGGAEVMVGEGLSVRCRSAGVRRLLLLLAVVR